MIPFEYCPEETLRGLRGVFTDLDETLTTNGRLRAATYDALERLDDAGLMIVPVTGRPAGWCDLIVRTWPVAGVVAETGALSLWLDPADGRLRRLYATAALERGRHATRLAGLLEEIRLHVSDAVTASDQRYRECDLAIDYHEDARLEPAQVERITALCCAAGAQVSVSSAHVNIWLGSHDKLSMSRELLAEAHGIDLDRERERFLFVGDSLNDESMFGFFPCSVGVANVARFSDRLTRIPRYVTRGVSGAGFEEIANRILECNNILHNT
ncbi:MAG: HAD-IIB family hydrolase [Candidatus Competibacterales bacterium]|nr:HAD-IIB family hydrolase [Candidatus Competibacterales bacterium]